MSTENEGAGNGTNVTVSNYCSPQNQTYYRSITGLDLVVPEWEAIITSVVLTFIILLTIVGNILVILSVFTYKPLRIVQNFFIVSLAVADLTVAILVMPLNVSSSILGKWPFGMHLCKMWLTCDILCCTASILNLCAIALDRYWAITDPINYAQQRTLNRVMIMIVGVWVLSGMISSPPLLGWNDWPETEEKFKDAEECRLTNQQGYIVYSSLGSFYIPLFIMTIVYIEIFIATRRRLRDRAKATKMNVVKSVASNQQSAQQQALAKEEFANAHADQDSVSSETNHNEHPRVEDMPSGKTKEKKRKGKKKPKSKAAEEKAKFLAPMLVMEDSMTDNHDSPSGSNHRTSLTHPDTATTNTESPKSRTAEVPLVPPELLPFKKPTGVYQFIEEKQKISLSKERRAARTLGIIMGVFVVCWLPFFLMYVILPFCPTCCVSDKFVNFITWLGYINSALNPIIYTIFNLDFRRAFKKLLHFKP